MSQVSNEILSEIINERDYATYGKRNNYERDKSNCKQVRFSEKLHELIPEDMPSENIEIYNENIKTSVEQAKAHRSAIFCWSKQHSGTQLRHVDSKILMFRREYYQPGGPSDPDMPPNNQQDYYRQQTVAGQPVYVQGPPPPPVQGGRQPAYRSGEETRQAREEKGERGTGGFMNIFGGHRKHGREDRDTDSESEQVERVTLFTTVQIRNQFVRKVYTLLSIQLFITFGFVLIAIHVEPIRLFLIKNLTVLIVVLVMTFVFVIALSCCQAVRRRFPCNLICLLILTCLYAYMLAAVSCVYDTTAVYMAVGAFLVSVLACQMKWDITKCGCLLYILLIGLLIYGIVCVILVNFVDPKTFRVLHLVYGGIGLAVFILFLMFDTQMIMGGRFIEMSPEEYIMGALQLYMDVIMIFQYILMLFRH